jgi:hypothetical protein
MRIAARPHARTRITAHAHSSTRASRLHADSITHAPSYKSGGPEGQRLNAQYRLMRYASRGIVQYRTVSQHRKAQVQHGGSAKVFRQCGTARSAHCLRSIARRMRTYGQKADVISASHVACPSNEIIHTESGLGEGVRADVITTT